VESAHLWSGEKFSSDADRQRRLVCMYAAPLWSSEVGASFLVLITGSLQLEFESCGGRAGPQSRRLVGVDLAAMPAMVTRRLLPSSEGWPRWPTK
jgi:hypothetical protein